MAYRCHKGRLALVALAIIVRAHVLWALPYGSAATLAVDGAPTALASFDIDGDHDLDLVTANQAGEDGPSLSVLYNFGNGSFGPEERLNLAGSRYIIEAVTAGDFDSNQFGDLAVAVDDIRTFPPTAAVLIYRNDATGQFLKPVAISLVGMLPTSIRSGDLDGDGRLDLTVSHVDAQTGSGVLSVLLGAAGGTFQVAARVPVGEQPSDTLIADVDADGRADVIVVDPGSDSLFVLYGNATPGLLDAPQPVGDIGTPQSVALRHEDGALPSLVVANGSGSEIVILGQATARELAVSHSQPVAVPPSDLELLGIDANGRELAALASLSDDAVAVVALGGSGTLQQKTVAAPSDLLAADLNGDGQLDLTATSLTADSAAVLLDDEEPAPTPTSTPPGALTPTVPGSTGTPGAATATPPLVVTATVAATPTRTPTCVVGFPGCHDFPTATRTFTPTQTATPTATSTGHPTTAPIEPGDANCDGLIDALDEYAIIEQLFLQDCAGADINDDGMITSADVLLFFMGQEMP